MLLKRLSELFNLPWLCCGDFNEISAISKKKGGNDKPYYLLSAFRETLNFCEFRDLGFKGPPFTWWTRRGGNDAIFERLDSVLGLASWCDLFPSYLVRHLSYWGFDHRPLFIEFDSVADDMNWLLLAPFTSSVIMVAVDDMSPSKALGRDGIPVFFYQKFWKLLGQSACIPGRLITNNAIVLFECVHKLRRMTSKKQVGFALKLDMSKAYDRVKWIFLEAIMNRLGFHVDWTANILLYVTSVRYWVLKCLTVYEEASGQSVNLDKSCVAFNLSLDFNICIRLGSILGVWIVGCHKKYLGLPISIGCSKYVAFESIRDRVWKRFQAWKGKLVSVGGKKVLLEVVIQAIPTYTMTCFKLPVALCKELVRICDCFWWGSTDMYTKIHWSSWDRLYSLKVKDGLGFRDIQSFNRAMLANQCWRLISNPDSLTARVLRSKSGKTGVAIIIRDHKESDVARVIKLFSNHIVPCPEMGAIIRNSLALGVSVNLLEVEAVRRGANSVAHSLAQLAHSLDGSVVWLEELPTDVARLVRVDSASFGCFA
ncbi:hypothetical protein Ddye_011672 [Dipteronia dyeriana]|uniref:Reverse transcriptase n=1 Tax=Dipteronia dyeriana TaxID=168575 RepID=A0AAD9X2Y7_9ROSI|nr:hypothetical protein Ddye_011672 [Dipteronia dyeriana]